MSTYLSCITLPVWSELKFTESLSRWMENGSGNTNMAENSIQIPSSWHNARAGSSLDCLWKLVDF